jgi:hypothetical protein
VERRVHNHTDRSRRTPIGAQTRGEQPLVCAPAMHPFSRDLFFGFVSQMAPTRSCNNIKFRLIVILQQKHTMIPYHRQDHETASMPTDRSRLSLKGQSYPLCMSTYAPLYCLCVCILRRVFRVLSEIPTDK